MTVRDVETEIVDLRDRDAAERFDRCVAADRSSLVQQTSTWAHVVQDIGPDRPLGLLASVDEEPVGALLLYLFRTEEGDILYSNPQAGSLGALAIPEAHKSEAGRIASALVEEACRRGQEADCLTLTLTSNPFHEDVPLEEAFNPDYILRSFIHYIDLGSYFDEKGNVALRDYNRRSNLSRNIETGRTSDLEVIESDDPGHLEAWYDVHEARLTELGGTPLPYALFESALRVAVPQGRATFHYVVDGGEVVGGGLHVHSDRIVDILMMSSTRDAQERGCNFLFVDHALYWARDRGFQVYNWQASNPPTGGIIRFKEQWGSQRRNFSYLTRVIGDRDRILDLGLERARNAYKDHYLVPFGVFEEPNRREFHKGDSEAFLPT